MNMTKETNLPVEAIQPILEELNRKALPSPSFPFNLDNISNTIASQFVVDNYLKEHNLDYIYLHGIYSRSSNELFLISKSGVMYDKFYKELKRDQLKVSWIDQAEAIMKYQNDRAIEAYQWGEGAFPTDRYVAGHDPYTNDGNGSISVSGKGIPYWMSVKEEMPKIDPAVYYEEVGKFSTIVDVYKKEKAERLKADLYYNKLLNDLQYHYEKNKTLVKEDTRAKEIHNKLEAFINYLKENKQKP